MSGDWFVKGDLRRRRHLRFMRRYNDMLKIGGENVDPMGVAFVRREHGRGRIASFKIPRAVFFVDDFPMTSSEKIQKLKLREEAHRRLM